MWGWCDLNARSTGLFGFLLPKGRSIQSMLQQLIIALPAKQSSADPLPFISNTIRWSPSPFLARPQPLEINSFVTRYDIKIARAKLRYAMRNYYIS